MNEPNNFFDIQAIEALNRYIVANGETIAFVSYDKVFIKRLAV